MEALFILLLVGLLMMIAGMWGLLTAPEVPTVQEAVIWEWDEEQRLYDEALRQMEDEINAVLLKASHEARKRGIG